MPDYQCSMTVRPSPTGADFLWTPLPDPAAGLASSRSCRRSSPASEVAGELEARATSCW
jgi:hypothetical protein